MNESDKKRLHKDPRYQAIVAVAEMHKARMAEIARLEAEAVEALRAAVAATGVGAVVNPKGDVYDHDVFNALRPRGDKCRFTPQSWTGRSEAEREVEIENVTAKRVKLGGGEFGLEHGYGVGPSRGKIHEDDLVKIRAGELKGWRQKPWPKS